jgi:hypothetical protein
VITPQERDAYLDATYRVLTVTLTDESPVLSEYVLTKEQVDDLLEGYEEYWDFWSASSACTRNEAALPGAATPDTASPSKPCW